MAGADQARRTLRRAAGRLRREAVGLLGGTLPTPHAGIPTAQLAQLAFGPLADADLERRAVEAVGAETIHDLSAVRRMLAVMDRHLTPSALEVRLGPADVHYTSLGDLDIALDGADVSVSRTVLAGAYEPHVTAVFNDYCRPGMTVVDVGANVGYFSMLAAQLVGPAGKVVAVEPSSENCRLLLTSIRRNELANVTVFPLAVAERRGWVYFGTHLGSNGSVRPDGGAELLDWPGVVVPTFCLDDIVDGPVHLIKLDAEGVEPLVVDGAHRIIQESRPVVVSEFSPGMQRISCGRDGKEYLDWFADQGYSIFLLERASGRRVPTTSSALLSPADRLDDILLVPAGLDPEARARLQLAGDASS